MKERKEGNKTIVEYNSIQEFVDYCFKTPNNTSFSDEYYQRSIATGRERKDFTGTESLEEALDLMRNGWGDGSEKLSHIFREKVKAQEIGKVRKNVIGVQGYQPIVPLYLANQPENMVSSVLKPMKQKIVTLDKDIAYSFSVPRDKIFEHSARALRVIHNFESCGYRCNLNIVLGTKVYPTEYYIKIKIKAANERFSISKMSFPLAHPSMLRRLCFKWFEVYPGVPTSFRFGYGSPCRLRELQKVYKDDYILPNFINDDLEKVKTIEELYDNVSKGL